MVGRLLSLRACAQVPQLPHVPTSCYVFLLFSKKTLHSPILGGVAQKPSSQLEALGDAAYDQIQIGRGLAWLILS